MWEDEGDTAFSQRRLYQRAAISQGLRNRQCRNRREDIPAGKAGGQRLARAEHLPSLLANPTHLSGLGWISTCSKKASSSDLGSPSPTGASKVHTIRSLCLSCWKARLHCLPFIDAEYLAVACQLLQGLGYGPVGKVLAAEVEFNLGIYTVDGGYQFPHIVHYQSWYICTDKINKQTCKPLHE